MKRLIILISLSLSPMVMAESSLNFSGYLKAGSASVNDPDGKTKPTVIVIPGIKATVDLSSRYTNLITGVEYISTSLDGSVKDIGQDVDGYSIYVGAERRFSVSRSTKLWLTGAFSYSDISFENRFTVDSDGFLEKTFENRSEGIAGISLAADVYFDVATSWRWGLGAFVDVPLGDGINVAGIKLTFGTR